MTDAAIPTAGPALSVWREKLAGVTPLIAEARNEAAFHRANGPDPNVAVLITRLADALECSDCLSRILADEASVEAAAESAGVEMYGTWHNLTRGTQDTIRETIRAAFNHLAQLALGDGG